MRLHDDIYCYYHSKLRAGLLEPAAFAYELVPRPGQPLPEVAVGATYPVWPLPATRYKVLSTVTHAA